MAPRPAGNLVSKTLDYYTRQGLITDPHEHVDLFRGLPTAIPAICQIIRGILIHSSEAHLYGVTLSSKRKQEANLRYIALMLARIRELDDRPLTVARAPEMRLVGSSRDFATMLCAILRQQAVPARTRCGFAVYLARLGAYADHWVCEYWKDKEQRWVLVDPQLDEVQRDIHNIAFDPHDVPRDQFLVAGKAWQVCRAGQFDSRRFGFGHWHGIGFIRSNLIKDTVALNKIEVLPSDHWWGLGTEKDLSVEDMAYLDHIATLTLGGNEAFPELRTAYENEPRLYSPVNLKLRELEEDNQQHLTINMSTKGADLLTNNLLASLLQPIRDTGVPSTHGNTIRPHLTRTQRISNLEPDKIVIRGAQQHNLKNINVSIPRYKLVVLTGVSGSGKSSLAFDTLYAEGQRRYVESLSPFVRHFLEKVEKPRLDYIGGLSPAIAIEQKTVGRNPRSTVGTVTEVFHYLRLLYSRIGTAHCLQCGSAIRPQSARTITKRLVALPPGTRFQLLAPIIRQHEGTHVEVIEKARRDGYAFARIDGVLVNLSSPIPVAEAVKHTIELLIDRLTVPLESEKEDGRENFALQTAVAVNTALRLGNGTLIVDLGDGGEVILSERLVCPNCGAIFPELTSQHFSFNSPFGMCPDCHGLGTKLKVDAALMVDNPHLSILDGALRWFGNLRKNKRTTWPLGQLDVIADYYGVDLESPWQDLPQKFRDVILYGSGDEKLRFPRQLGGEDIVRPVNGLIYEIDRLFRETESDKIRDKYGAFVTPQPCSSCGGTRLCVEARSVTLGGKTIAEVSAMPIDEALTVVEKLYDYLDRRQVEIADEILKEVRDRLQFMVSVGLHYLTLDRPAPSLSSGEGQRVRLASQLGCGLVGVLYVLDEPSIGLHARDRRTLLDTLLQLRDMGNTVLVVEHDEEIIRNADWIVDLGPGAGVLGGELVAAGPPEVVIANPRSLTGRYLSGELTVAAPNGGRRRKPTNGWLTITGARMHNLKNVNASLPLGLLICITGVSGSGKSSLIAKTLEPALESILYNASTSPGPYDWIEGVEHIDKVINIAQDPIGRTPRSNPATYANVFDQIRQVFADTPEAGKRGYKPGHFSFNVRSGRCETCEGYGQKKIEMHFLPDIWVTCQDCEGKRYSEETLAIRYKGKNIAEVLDMDVREALEFFTDYPQIARILQTLHDVGLDYIKLGQSATTLSGGEAQRVKLARELSSVATGRTLYILDEPTTGLHFADIQHLLDVLHRLVDAGNSVVVIEHNLDVIKTADWIIDLGPEGGEAGGTIVALGPPEEVVRVKKSYTGQALRKVIGFPSRHKSLSS